MPSFPAWWTQHGPCIHDAEGEMTENRVGKLARKHRLVEEKKREHENKHKDNWLHGRKGLRRTWIKVCWRKLFACVLLPRLKANACQHRSQVERLVQEYQHKKEDRSTLYSKQETQRKRRSSRRFSCDTDKSVNHFCNTISSAFFSTHSRQMRRLRLDSAMKLPCWRLAWGGKRRQNEKNKLQKWPCVWVMIWKSLQQRQELPASSARSYSVEILGRQWRSLLLPWQQSGWLGCSPPLQHLHQCNQLLHPADHLAAPTGCGTLERQNDERFSVQWGGKKNKRINIFTGAHNVYLKSHRVVVVFPWQCQWEAGKAWPLWPSPQGLHNVGQSRGWRADCERH